MLWPVSICWCSESAKNCGELRGVRVTGQIRCAKHELGKNAPDRPHVHGGRVRTTAQQKLRSTVPARHDLRRHECAGIATLTRKAKVSNFELTTGRDE